jgi:hypothetical protein
VAVAGLARGSLLDDQLRLGLPVADGFRRGLVS